MDPFTAYATAHSAIAGIKGAIALGKDIKSIMGEIGKFYHASDIVHHAATKKRIESIRKSDEDINKQAFDLAWKRKELWEQEKELRSYMFLTGNRDVWEDMMSERTRLAKERAEMERQGEEQKQKDREAIGNTIMNALLFFAGLAVIVPFGAIVWQLTTR